MSPIRRITRIRLTWALLALSAGIVQGQDDDLFPPLSGHAYSRGEQAGPNEFVGILEASRTLNIGSDIGGVLETVEVEPGDVVHEGQVVARLHSEVDRASLRLAEARAESTATLRRREARLAFDTAKLANDEKLNAEGLISHEELERSRTEKALAEVLVEEARENARLAKLELDRAKAALNRRTITSPIDGVVVRRFLSPGELVTRHNRSRILQIARVHPLRAVVALPVAMFGRVKPGHPATIRLEVLPEPFEARSSVKRVDPFVDVDTGMFRVLLEVPNPETTPLVPGLPCRVSFERQ